MWVAEERYRYDPPAFPGGLTAGQEDALPERFGRPHILHAPQAASALLWALWAWLPWLVLGVVTAV